jgi:hypothetical protein
MISWMTRSTAQALACTFLARAYVSERCRPVCLVNIFHDTCCNLLFMLCITCLQSFPEKLGCVSVALRPACLTGDSAAAGLFPFPFVSLVLFLFDLPYSIKSFFPFPTHSTLGFITVVDWPTWPRWTSSVSFSAGLYCFFLRVIKLRLLTR